MNTKKAFSTNISRHSSLKVKKQEEKNDSQRKSTKILEKRCSAATSLNSSDSNEKVNIRTSNDTA